MRLADRFINRRLEAQWSADVTKAAKYHPPEGTFTKGATAIASQLAGDSDSLKQAMSRLNFYINRAGTNLSSERRKVLNQAKKKLRDMMGGGK